MDYKKFKLGVGPMSREVVDLCLDYSEDYQYPLMIIASRNQADATSGYAFTSQSLADYVRSHPAYNPDRVLLCRDHCGPYFSDGDRALSLEAALDRCKETIVADIAAKFDLIHIDVSRVPPEHQERVSHELFDYALQLNPKMVFEYGSEDNSIENLDAATDALQKQITTVDRYKNHIVFMVSRTGSLTKQRQIGTFSVETNQRLADTIHSHGLLFKEHNADYLDCEGVTLRARAGVDAINIAPQLGCAQSEVLWNMAQNTEGWTQYCESVIDAGYWVRWCTPDVIDTKTKFTSSAHYCFSWPAYAQIVQQLPADKFRTALRRAIHTILDEYRVGYKS